MFTILDHDCDLLDPTLLARPQPAAGDAIVGLGRAEALPHPVAVPLTHCMAFAAPPLAALMRHHGGDARVWRRTPASAADAFARLGLAPGARLKPAPVPAPPSTRLRSARARRARRRATAGEAR